MEVRIFPAEVGLRIAANIKRNPTLITFAYEEKGVWQVRSLSPKIADREIFKLVTEGVKVWGTRPR